MCLAFVVFICKLVFLFLCINIFLNCCCIHVATDTSSASEDEGSLRRRQAAISAMLAQNLQSPEYWINRSVQGSSTSSSASSTLSHGDGKTHNHNNHSQGQTSALADVLAHTRIGTARSWVTQTHVFKCWITDDTKKSFSFYMSATYVSFI